MVSRGINRCRLVLLIVLTAAMRLSAQHLCEGDLLFVCNEAGNAITQVTGGVEDLPIDHVLRPLTLSYVRMTGCCWAG